MASSAQPPVRLERPANHEQTHQPAQPVDDPLHGVRSRGTTTSGDETHYAWLLTRASSISAGFVRWCAHSVPTLNCMDLLPVGLRVEEGTIVLANASVQSLIIAHFSHANCCWLQAEDILPENQEHLDQIVSLQLQFKILRRVGQDERS